MSLHTSILNQCMIPESVLALKDYDIKNLLVTTEIVNTRTIVVTDKKQYKWYQKLVNKKAPDNYLLLINGYGGYAEPARYAALQILKSYLEGGMDELPLWLWPQAFEDRKDLLKPRRLIVLDGFHKDIIASRLEVYHRILMDNKHKKIVLIMYDNDFYKSCVERLHYKPNAFLNMGRWETQNSKRAKEL